MKEGPDFLCVGMHKGGTRWLFDQLQHHADFWMPPLKELHYLERGDKKGKNALQALEFALGQSQRRKKQSNTSREWDDRDIAFLREMASGHKKPLDLCAYGQMFRHKGALISGDITPHYCDLEEDIVRLLRQEFPDLRIVLLVRDPIKRAWSHISQASRHGGFDEAVLNSPRAFAKLLREDKSLGKLSFPSRAAQRWGKHFANRQFRYFFMEDIASRAAEVRREILEYLGADPAKPSGDLPPDHNPKSKFRKLEMSDAIRSELVSYFADELRACASTFGGHATAWLIEYGIDGATSAGAP
ncbi:MAG TPA: sulfotransferase [Rhizomicrobium sp.]|nr:sulfotransferase [Rhizomicrobium sp.]